MKNLKPILIVILISSLAVIQIIQSYYKIKKQIFFYPYWKVYLSQNTVFISNNQGFFTEISVKPSLIYPNIIDQESRKLTIKIINKNNVGDFHLIKEKVRFCNHCFVINYKEKQVFTKKNINDDIILKKKLVNKGYQINADNNFKINLSKFSLGIYNPLTQNLLIIDTPKSTRIFLLEEKNELELEINNYQAEQKLYFYD